MMHWIIVFIIGLIIGVLAKLLVPGPDSGGIIVTALLGIAGSLIATYVSERWGLLPLTGWKHFVGSVGGAVILLLIYNAIFARPRRL
ncbi:GlsB/YeaQ/YmgE family stress response membrane protein [Dyella sp. GSA-30]|uniref:GlsB/YeaQ/YmgE family stress response membrane protein n=1 Tax=Dyella sp. GSA-30 TaxID=2994496 RepID=UPI002491D4E4|nr:GlsB/YeaQ/YmgE family stress response membrane protein [Dyella sp. GSA-30]BDU20732.1 hypothetical protein DYGSA30_21890 [Dyella sp. GSA-30]